MPEVNRLLLVDDDADLLNLLKLKLQKTGKFEVLTTTDGAKAVSLAIEFEPDLILLDIEMPEMDGAEVAEALKDNPATSQIPVLFLSSMIQKTDVERSGGKSGQRHIASKSMSVKDLVERIDDIISP